MMSGAVSKPRLLLFFISLFAICVCVAEPARNSTREMEAQHTRSVELGRAGKYDDALRILDKLLQDFPDNYPYNRDHILITIWKGDCKGALTRFEQIRAHEHPPYLIIPVSDCLLDQSRPKEAATLVRTGLDRYPEDANLKHALLKATLAVDAALPIDEDRPAVVFELATDESDQGLREWISYLEGSARVAERTRIYARHRIARSDEAGLGAGDFDRAGIGVRYRFNEQMLLDQEFSMETKKSGKAGAATALVYEPRDTWKLTTRYTTFAEDLPLRARAEGVEGKHGEVGAEYNSMDYVWYGLVTLNRYDFSDTNRRGSLFGTLGYTFEALPYREQTLYGELYESSNTLDDAPYFNPKHDRSVGIVHRTNFIFESRFKRHMDSLFLSLNSYWQEDFGTHGKWGVRYEQDYNFDGTSHLNFGLAYDRNVYDGQSEYEARFDLRYVKSF
jgi:tetratricopeptide (TPR) repeat protein